MGEIRNLRTARKQAAREAERAQAAENAARHGQTKAERVLQAARSDKARRVLDQHRIEDDEA